MGLLDIVRGGLATADSITKDLQPNVQHWAWIGQDGEGRDVLVTVPASRACIVEERQRMIRTADGHLVQSRFKLTFPYAIPAHGAEDRQEPVDLRDKFVLPDGTTGPTLEIGGLTDRATGGPMFTEVWIG